MRTIELITADGEALPVVAGKVSLPAQAQTSRVALELPEGLSFDEWSGLGQTLRSMESGVLWWIGDWLRYGERRFGETYSQAIEVTGYGEQHLTDAKWVASQFDFSDRSEKLSWTHHRFAAALPRPERADVMKLAEQGGWSVRELRAEVSRRKAVKLIGATEVDPCTVADLNSLVSRGLKFGCIYADPPWQYDNQGTRAATGNHYNGMTVDELCELPIRHLAADNAHLHLWTTNGFIFDAPRIFEAWGFEFRSSLVWVKPQIGIGNYWRNAHEFLLTAIRGDAKRFNDKSLKSWIECDRGQHSAKPEQVRAMLEKASPGPRLELFGRRSAENWVVWGNQIERSIFDAAAEAA